MRVSDDVCVGTVPPDAPDATAALLGEPATFAVDALLFGEPNDAGTNTTGWQDLGFNLDGRSSPVARSFAPGGRATQCGRASGAPSSVQFDGNGCIDNSFGANLVPFFEAWDNDPQPSLTHTNRIRAGAFTLQLQIRGLDLSANDPSATGLTAQSFASNAFDPNGTRVPTFTASEDWPLRSDLHPDPAVGAPFAAAYVSHGTFVARDGDVVLSIVEGPGRRIELRIHHAIVVMDVTGDRADKGTLAGLLDIAELIADVQKFATASSKSLCGSAYDGIAQQLRQCVDILDDGTSSAGKPCNAISLGIGFTAKRIANPKRTAPPEPIRDLCSTDAGADAPADAPGG